MELKEYMDRTKPKTQDRRARKSQLLAFKSDIRELLDKGYSHTQITEYLSLNNIKVARQTVTFFIQKHIRG